MTDQERVELIGNHLTQGIFATFKECGNFEDEISWVQLHMRVGEIIEHRQRQHEKEERNRASMQCAPWRFQEWSNKN